MFRMEQHTVRNVQLQHSAAAENKKHKLCCLFGRKKLPDEKNSEWSGFCSVGNDMQSVSDRKADCWQGCGNFQTSWEQWGCKPISIEKTAAKKHIFTHIEWQMFGVYLTCAAMPEMFVWKTAAELQAELTLPTAFRQFLQEELQ